MLYKPRFYVGKFNPKLCETKLQGGDVCNHCLRMHQFGVSKDSDQEWSGVATIWQHLLPCCEVSWQRASHPHTEGGNTLSKFSFSFLCASRTPLLRLHFWQKIAKRNGCL